MEADLSYEQATIGAALHNGTEGLMALVSDDFTDRRHRESAIVIHGMVRRGLRPDALTVAAELDVRGKSFPNSVLYLMDLSAAVELASNSWWYASKVREIRRAKLIDSIGQKLSQGANHDPEQILREHADLLATIPPALDESGDSELPTIAELFEQTFSKRWVVPGMLACRERVVLTAAEGLGKSVLSTQWAICLAAGLHPFTGARLDEPKRVLLLDAENSPEQTQNRYQWAGDRVTELGGVSGWAKRINHQIRPEGFDITGRDRQWFSNTVAKASPDLIVMGPAYKMMGAAKTSDDAAILAFFAVLDEIRVKHDTALLIEAHSGHAKDDDKRSVRPFGSSVWMRWPEIGVGLRRSDDLDAHEPIASVVDVVHWRGNREQRDWPTLLKRGGDRELPWSPMQDDGYWQKAKGK